MNKICTSIEQSKKLMELGIDTSTADMYIDMNHEPIYIGVLPTNGDIDYESMNKHNLIPAWSLNALLELLELPTLLKDSIGKGKTGWMVTHYDVNGMRYDSNYFNNPIDACVEMIKLLHEQKLL